MEMEKQRFSILMFPWLAHGHIFPYLELAKRIVRRRNFHIYLCTTPINFSSIKDFLDRNMLRNSVELVELHLQPCPELPPHYHTTKNLPSSLMHTLIKAFQTSDTSFTDIIKTLQPDLILYDIFQPWAPKIAATQGIPSIHFAGFGATTVLVLHHQYSEFKDPNFQFEDLCLQGHEKVSMDNLINLLAAIVYDGFRDIVYRNFEPSSEIVLLKTSKALEGKNIDYASSTLPNRIMVVGPLVTEQNDIISAENAELLQWLDKKDRHSTAYISFGSECFLSAEEIGEIAKGLELSGVNFVWVIRFPIGEEETNLDSVLPEGFRSRVRERGIITGWAPQTSILAHPSTGGFVSHCGWSSITESVYYGVPMIGMPMKLNMFIDAKMAAKAGICLIVPREEDTKFTGENIGKVLKQVIMEQSGEDLRSEARKISEKMRLEEEEALDNATEELWKICSKKTPKPNLLV